MFTREAKKTKIRNEYIDLFKPWNLDDEIFYTWENQSENRHIHCKLVNNVNPINYENN